MPLPVPLEGGWGARYQHILLTIVFQACIGHLRHGGLFAVFFFHTGIRENLKYRCLKPNFIVFSSMTLTSLLESLQKLLPALTHTCFAALVMATQTPTLTEEHVHAHCTFAACLCNPKFEKSMYFLKELQFFLKTWKNHNTAHVAPTFLTTVKIKAV